MGKPTAVLLGSMMGNFDEIAEVEDLRQSKDLYLNFLNKIEKKIEIFCEVLNLGITGNEKDSENIKKNVLFRKTDMIIIVPMTYTLDSVISTLLSSNKKPVILLSSEMIKYIPSDSDFFFMMTYGPIASISSLTNILIKMYQKYDLIIGDIDDEKTITELKNSIDAAKAFSYLEKSVIGLIGNNYPGMNCLKIEKEILKKDLKIKLKEISYQEIIREYKSAKENEVKIKIKKINEFNTESLKEDDIIKNARLSVAIEKIAIKHKINCFAQLCQPMIIEREIGFPPCIAFSLLHEEGIMTICEYDIANACLMVIFKNIFLDAFFSEFYVHDTNNNYIFCSHCGMANINFCSKKNLININTNPCYQGINNGGLSFHFQADPGHYILGSMTQINGKLRIIAGNVENLVMENFQSKTPQFNLRFKNRDVKTNFRKYCLSGGVHHFIVAKGGTIEPLIKFCDYSAIELFIL